MADSMTWRSIIELQHPARAACGIQEGVYENRDRPSPFRAVSRRGAAIPGSLVFAVFSSLFALCTSAVASDESYTYRRLHSFCLKENCPDGGQPAGALAMDRAGDLYGTTIFGGRGLFTGGVVYRLKQQHKKFHVIYAFCYKVANCSTGRTPQGNPIIDGNENLYGTTVHGAGADGGTVFRLSPKAGGTTWKIATLYDFCLDGNGCPDGQEPVSGLTYAGAASGLAYDGKSPLYGTTSMGGANDHGTVFELRPRNHGKGWRERVLYSFCSQANCTDGQYPGASSTPAVDSAGNIYGSTTNPGGNGPGLIYELRPGPPGQSWTEMVLHNFNKGVGSFGHPLIDASGNIYDLAGGGKYGEGFLFELVHSGAKWKLHVLHSYCAEPACADGARPSDVAMDVLGNFYGVTEKGGSNDYGTAFDLVPDGSKWKLSVLHSFCRKTECADGALPETIVLSPDGNLFGTTEAGGKGVTAKGIAFELNPD